MATLEILHYPDERLKLKAKNVVEFNSSLEQIIADMAETMYQFNGIGLAAIQVNIQKRIFITDLAKDGEPSKLVAYINPKIINTQGQKTGDEGCLSVPGIFEPVTRAEVITLEYQDTKGTKHSVTCEGLQAVCLQHELDHLDGKVFVEYLSNLKQNFIKKKMKKLFK
jgi:peptide deformylase